MRAQFCPRKTLLGTDYKQTQAPVSSVLGLAHICIKMFPFLPPGPGILLYGTGEGQKVQTWGCNYLSCCDSCVLSKFCLVLFHFLQYWLIRGIEEQIGSSTFSSQCLVPNLGRDKTEQTGMAERLGVSSKCV